MPGAHAQTDPELRDYIRANAWGHHASCTCPIGPRETGGAVGGSCFATEWGYAIAFLFFMVVIFIRPQGLFGGKS